MKRHIKQRSITKQRAPSITKVQREAVYFRLQNMHGMVPCFVLESATNGNEQMNEI